MTLEDVSVFVVLIGYGVSIFMGDFVIRPIRRRMYEGFEESGTPHHWRPRVVGWIERTLYTSSIVFEFPEFIAIWLALKVAGQWERWKIDLADKKLPRDAARAAYSVYLVGNGLSILYAGAGAFVILNYSLAEWRWIAIVISVLAILSFGLYRFIRTRVDAAAELK